MASADQVPHDTKHDLPHEGPIKTPKQLIVAVFFAFLVPVVVITLIVTYVSATHKPAAGSDAMTPEAIARRLQPVGDVEIRDVSDATTLASGDKVYAAQCAACHATGAVGAPKLADKQAWAPRLASGYETLLQSALKGKGNMPPQGGGDFSELEIARAVVYMANQAGGDLPEPQAPAAPATAAAPAGADEAAKGAAEAPKSAAEPAKGTDEAAKGRPDAEKGTAEAAKGTSETVAAAAPAAQAGAQAAAQAVPALYTQSCQVCHATGVAGAPKVGDEAAWAPRIAKGLDTVTQNAIKGLGAMPPRGGSTASDAEIRDVVTYMVNASK